MRKAVLFDLDDTIFDHQHSRRLALAALMKVHPAMAGQDIRNIEAAHERHLQTTHSMLLEGRISIADGRRKRMRLLFSDYGLTLSDDEVSEAEDLYRRTYDRSRRAVPGVISIITALKNSLKLAIITNGLVVEQEEKIRICGLDGKMDATVISEKAGVRKPSKEIFNLALSELKTAPAEAIVIGDSWNLDVIGARNAGMPAVWFNRYEGRCPEPGSVVEVTSLEPVDRLLGILTG